MRRVEAGPVGKILATIAILVALAWIAVETPRSLVATLGLVPTLMLAALVWGPAMCRSGARLFSGSLYWPEVDGVSHAPLAALDALIVAERWDVAEAQVRGLCRQWPADPEVWTRRIHLAWRQPVDVQRARAAHRAALAGIIEPAERERIDRLYAMLAESRLADQAALEDERRALEDRCARWICRHAVRNKRKKRALIGLPCRRTEWSNSTNSWAPAPRSGQLTQSTPIRDRG